MAIGFKLTNASAFNREMLSRKNKLGNRRKVNAQALTIVDRWVQKNFQSQGKLATDGQGWQKLSASTLLQRRKGGGKVSILQDTGQLRQRWKHIIRGTKIAILRSMVQYSIYHEEGTKKMPQRRILPEEEHIQPQLEKVFNVFIKKAIR